jgi:hypothetical protein
MVARAAGLFKSNEMKYLKEITKVSIPRAGDCACKDKESKEKPDKKGNETTG